MMIRCLFVAAAALLLAVPAIAEDETCWVCDSNAECAESTEPNFARKTCEERRICAQSVCADFCVTGSEECAIEDSGGGDRPPWWPWNTPQFFSTPILSAHPESREAVTEAFDSLLVGVLASQSLQGRHVGPGDGVIAFDGTRQSYRFSRRVEVDERGLVVAAYRLKGHPALARVTVESPSRGVDIFVTVEQRDGEQHFEAFTFDQ